MVQYLLLTARPAPEAHLLCGALRAEGLRVRLQRETVGAVYGLTTGLFATRVLVAADDYDAAHLFLADVEATEHRSC